MPHVASGGAAPYDDDPEAELPITKLYQEVRDAVDDLIRALLADGGGVAIVPVGLRQGWRLDLSGVA